MEGEEVMILDSETAAFIKVAQILAPTLMLPQTGLATIGTDRVTVRPEIERWIRGRVEMIQAGVEKCPQWFSRQLRLFDPDLRMRWDFYKSHWVIERFNQLDNLFHACGIWDQPLGQALIQALREGDLWRTTPGEVIKKQHEAAERQQKANDHQVSEQLGEAVDRMSNKQVHEFVDASEALANGDELIPGGEDAKFFQRLYDKNKELQAKGIDVPQDPGGDINYKHRKRH